MVAYFPEKKEKRLMELKVKRENLTNSLQLHDIVFAVIETKNVNLLKEMMENVRDDHSKNLKDDIFLNSSVELKSKMKDFMKLAKIENYDLDAKPQYTNEFVKRSFNTKEPVTLKLNGNSFHHLQKAILDTKNANTILGFAHQYKVDDAMFLKELSKLGQVYEKAYRREVMKDYRYQKDELQLYM